MISISNVSQPGPLQAVILDWAGTTIDHGSRAPAQVFLDVFATEGVTLTEVQARLPMGLAKRDHIREIHRISEVGQMWRSIHQRDWTEEDVDRMYRSFIPRQLEVLADHAELIPGTREAVEQFRQRGLKIGSSTGYSREMIEILIPLAKDQGYEPDAVICQDDVGAGRPAPFLIYRNAEWLNVYPNEAIVAIGDTVADVESGRNAGCWTIAVTETGNGLGLSAVEVATMGEAEKRQRLAPFEAKLRAAGAHFLVPRISECPQILDQIEQARQRGERP